jgi:hypothetical protein
MVLPGGEVPVALLVPAGPADSNLVSAVSIAQAEEESRIARRKKAPRSVDFFHLAERARCENDARTQSVAIGSGSDEAQADPVPPGNIVS